MMYVVTARTDFTKVSFTNGMSWGDRVTSFTRLCNLIYAHQKVRLSLRRFMWNSHMLNSMLSKALMLNVTQSGK
jgi:hypothetical protein